MEKIEIYTDGSCHNQTDNKNGTWSFVAVSDGDLIKRKVGMAVKTTSPLMELTAVMEALKWLVRKKKRGADITIYTDCKYVSNGIMEWMHDWKANNWLKSNGKPVKNGNIWKAVYNLYDLFKYCEIEWVEGHSGNYYNEMAHDLAYDTLQSMAELKLVKKDKEDKVHLYIESSTYKCKYKYEYKSDNELD